MEWTLIINGDARMVADYIKRITTFEGPMPQRKSELPMSPNDAGKPIRPTVQNEHGFVSLQPMQLSNLSEHCIAATMEAQQWRISSAGLLLQGRVWAIALNFTLEALTADKTMLTTQCELSGFQRYANEIVRSVIKKFGAEESDQDTNQPSTKERRNRERERVKASLVYWATVIKQLTTQAKACATMNMNERTYRRYRDDKLLFDDNAIEEMGATFEDLWNTIKDGGDMEDLLEFE